MALTLITFAADEEPPLEVAASDDAGTDRTVSGLVVPFGVKAARPWGTSIFTAEGTRLPDDLATVKLLNHHDAREPVGYATAAEYGDDGLRMTFTVPASHERAAGYLADLDANLRDGFSVGIEMDETVQEAIWSRLMGDSDGPVEMAGVVREVSGVAVPAFNDARADRNSNAGRMATFTATPRQEHPPVSEAPPVTLPTIEELAALVAPLVSQRAAHELSQFASYDDFAAAVWAGTVEPFALQNQITSDNPGVIQPAWLTEIVGIIDKGRPAITALGGPRALPDAGMSLTWPKYTGDLTGIVAKQAVEKTEVQSAKVSFTSGNATIDTYAGASDISYQLLRRSAPSYREAYDRILALAYALVTEQAFEAALIAGATALPAGVNFGNAAGTLRRALFRASLRVRRATGRPADVILVAENVFENWASLDGLFPSAYGTQNASGTAQASTLSVNVSGLEITPVPYFAAGTVIATNSEAAAWHEDGPYPLEQEDVAKLGKDVGIWGMGASRIALAAGVLSLTSAVEV